jgi:hypothetical protein
MAKKPSRAERRRIEAARRKTDIPSVQETQLSTKSIANESRAVFSKKLDSGLFFTIIGVLAVPLVFAFQANGVVTVSWIPSIVIYSCVIAGFIWAFLRWDRASHWSPLKRYGALASITLSLCGFSVDGVMTQYQKENLLATVKEASTFASGIVAYIDNDKLFTDKEHFDLHHRYRGTGVLIRDDWYIATCTRAVDALPAPTILLAKPPFIDKNVLGRIAFGVMGTVVVTYDGVAIVRMNMPASIPKMRPVDPRDVNPVFGYQSVPAFDYGLPEVGQRVFLSGVENGTPASFGTFEGKIIRVGEAEVGHGMAMFSTLPFKDSYCGAPVINEHKTVIGLMSAATPDGTSEILLAREILHAMIDAKLTSKRPAL